MFSLVTVSCLLGAALSVPVRFEPPKENAGWWYDAEATPWDTQGAQLQNSPFYQTFRQMDKQLDMYGYAQHVGKINRGEYYNPELNLPGDRAFGYKGDFNAKDLASGAFRHAPRGQQVVAEPVHVELGMADSVGEIITVGAGQFIKPDGTILLHTLPSPNPCHYGHPCADVFPGYRATCVALDTTTAKCERIVNGKYSAWSDFGACNADCEKEKTRTCDNPAPSNGGAACVGPSSEVETCLDADDSTDECVDGGWGVWSDFGACNFECKKEKTRTCDSPAPSSGGAACVGPSSEVESCLVGDDSTDLCADGGWGGWQLYDPALCDATCQVVVTRLCDNPAPSPGGADCVADADGGATKTDTTSCKKGTDGYCP